MVLIHTMRLKRVKRRFSGFIRKADIFIILEGLKYSIYHIGSEEKGLVSKGFVKLILQPKGAKPTMTESSLELYVMLSLKINKNLQKIPKYYLYQ